MIGSVLLVEDDENKREQLAKVIGAALPGASIATARSYHGALDNLIHGAFDLIVLDMTLPTFDVTKHDDGGTPQAFAGRELLRQMARKGVRGRVLVVTQFDRFGEGTSATSLEELDAQMRKDYAALYVGSIQYEEVTGTWSDELARRLVDLGKD